MWCFGVSLAGDLRVKWCEDKVCEGDCRGGEV